MCPSRGEGGFVLSTRPPLVLCAGNKLSSGSNEARNCKLSREAQRRDKGLVFAGNVHEDESDMAESHATMGVMIPPLLWRVMFNPSCLCIHLQIFLSPLICINTLRALFNTDLSDSIFPLVLTAISLLLLRWRITFERAADVEAFAGRLCRVLSPVQRKRSPLLVSVTVKCLILDSCFSLWRMWILTDRIIFRTNHRFLFHWKSCLRLQSGQWCTPPACTACSVSVVSVHMHFTTHLCNFEKTASSLETPSLRWIRIWFIYCHCSRSTQYYTS